MSILHNIPCFSIILSMFAAIITSATKGKVPRKISLGLAILNIVLSLVLLLHLVNTGDSFVYVMGHVPAPWGNELRAGMLEAGMALMFCTVMFIGLLGGYDQLILDIDEEHVAFYYIMIDLMLASNLALVYTNDIFTGYVFVEINTTAACGLILGRFRGRTIASAIQYMIMAMIGSGLLLLGMCFLYDITGHLLMSNIHQAILTLPSEYRPAFLISALLITVGLAIKSALWPFHTWLPNSYGTSTPMSSVMLSSIISKGYIFFLIKFMIRVCGFNIFMDTKLCTVLFVLGIFGMMSGSLDAIRQANIRRMVAYSSVAQIGYIYMGLGLGNQEGLQGAVYHMVSHASAKSLAFIAIAGLIATVNGDFHINRLKGSFFRNKWAGIAFMVASFSMIGIPGFAGFASKFILAKAALDHPAKALIVLLALAFSTLLNTFYFMRVAIIIFTPLNEEEKEFVKNNPLSISFSYKLAIIIAILVNLYIGIRVNFVTKVIIRGLAIFM